MPEAESAFHYAVAGSWPFPLDMLRKDRSRAATADDQRKIDLLTTGYAVDRSSLRDVETVHLVMDDPGRFRPDAARWDSFGWTVEGDAEHDLLRAAAREGRRSRALYDDVMGRLTPEERDAVVRHVPRDRH